MAILLAAGCSDDKETPFRIEIDIQPTASASNGMRFSVNEETTSRIWTADYSSLSAACTSMEFEPLKIECINADGSPCGKIELFEVCCWSPSILSSPLTKGTVYIRFDGNGLHTVEEGRCEALDGSSTHGDRGPDAGL